MPHPEFDRSRLVIKSLKERKNQISFPGKLISLAFRPEILSNEDKYLIQKTARKIINARKENRAVILAFGAHTIKNGLGVVLTGLIQKGWVTHLATNGAGIIHDWEIAFQGKSGENVRENVNKGEFGIWQETGFFLNLALITGACEKLGYGESIGKMISREGLSIPEPALLLKQASEKMETYPEEASAAIELYDTIRKFDIRSGFMKIPHPYKKYSVQCSAFELNIPFTGHPMIGHDIIYTHPVNKGSSIGRTAQTDFLRFAHSVSNLENGVYLSVGSAVMSPMIFEKSLSMSQNLEIQNGGHINNHFMLITDLARNEWDWNKNGEPPPDNPAYYLRYCKTFSRMGGEMNYISADNRDIICELYHSLLESDHE